ncbi:hypothetical protein HO173_000512 [Letharia columbiana]|uniref:Uncharacterized protein n=1 Tax=Letharia columbiana TaxID=112416 RepID=A0A8H6G7L0_9LECA|nr:uncharacterized protein HO173_000512 [Letharia columbiana]KAF6241800.1 hypothetical protein HO173_000512 [Letharia columbiana]
MTPKEQSLYGQMPVEYAAGEKEETYLQMMNDLAEEECSVGPQQSQHSHTKGISGNQNQKKGVTKAQGSNKEKKPKHKVKRQTRFENGRLEFLQDPDALVQQWEPAVRMDDCRRELIDQQNRLAAQLGMSYRDPDPVGTGKDDETAFKIEHADWDSDRAHLPGICWRYNEDEDNNPRPSDNPGYMRFKGMIVLDSNDSPVKDWPQLPVTLSSKIRGYRLEIMSRENPHLEYKDFIARMPSVIEKTKKDKDTGETEVVIEAPDPNVVCNMRMLRFRRDKGLLSWTEKGNTKVIGEGLEKLFGDRLINNSMQSFGRDLTPQEQMEIRKGKNAQFPKQNAAGGSPTQVATKKRKTRGDTKTLKRQSKALIPEAPRQKRPREDDEDLDSSDDQNLGQATAASYRKRRRNARGEVSKPTLNLDPDQALSAAGIAPKIIEVGSNPRPPASNHLSDGSYGDESDEHLLETKTKTMESTREQDYDPRGDIGSQEDATDEKVDDDMTDVDDLADDLNRGKAHGSVEDLVEEDVEEDVTPVIRQETDLERHRRLTREFLGEEDDFFFKTGSSRFWTGGGPIDQYERSYGSQFQEIFTTFNDWWGDHSDEPSPGLTGAMHFGALIYD